MTFDQLYNLVLEQSNPIQPVNLPSPEEQAQKQQAFQQQQQKSVQDVKSLGSGVLEVAKFLDPTGILSWDDVKKAQDAFKKDPSGTNGLMYMLAIGSVVPVMGKATKPLKMAVRSGNATAIQTPLNNLIQNIKNIIDKTAVGMDEFFGIKVDPNQFQKAYNAIQGQRGQLVDDLVTYNQKMQSQGFKQLTPETHYKRPTAKQFVGNIVQRNFYPNVPKNSKGERELAKKMDLKAEELKRAADGYGWNDSFAKEIKVLDRQNYHNRDVIEIDIPFEEGRKKILMYKSYKGTSGKQQGYWYPILGFTDSWFIKSDKGVDLTEYSSPFFKGLAEYLLRYGPEGLRQ